MGSFSKNASCAVLPLSLALAGVTCIAQSTEDPRFGAIAQADTPTGTTTSSVPNCDVDGGDAGFLAPYLAALQGSPYWAGNGAAGWGSVGPANVGWGGLGPSYAGWGWGGGLASGYGGVGLAGYYGSPYGYSYGYGYGWPYYGADIPTESSAPPCQ